MAEPQKVEDGYDSYGGVIATESTRLDEGRGEDGSRGCVRVIVVTAPTGFRAGVSGKVPIGQHRAAEKRVEEVSVWGGAQVPSVTDGKTFIPIVNGGVVGVGSSGKRDEVTQTARESSNRDHGIDLLKVGPHYPIRNPLVLRYTGAQKEKTWLAPKAA